MASSRDHIEKTLADAYRKEIEQEENIWCSLPFFAAAQALELGAIYQIAGHLPPVGTVAWWISTPAVATAGVATLTGVLSIVALVAGATAYYIPPG
ncbi:MAG: hypothetical protein EXR07_08720 [Acetobacteraceae bacterium]|nr:hypothetical protein [Acetobacteraceae bacterium]